MKKLLSICSLLFGIIILFMVGFFIYHSPDQPLADENAKPAAIPDFAKAEVIKEAEVIIETQIAENTQAVEIEKAAEKAPLTESPEEIAVEKNEPKALDTPTYIKQSLIELLENSLKNNNEDEVLKDMPVGKLLTMKELAAANFEPQNERISELAEFNDESYRHYHKFFLVDADNDGNDDIVAYLHSGGSIGLVDLIFYQGDGKGTFRETFFTGFGIYAENTFIEYNGKNYFLHMRVDYNKKVKCGFDLYYFADGAIKECAYISEMPESYTLAEKNVLSDEYTALADELSVVAPKIYFELNGEGTDIITGSAETQLNEQETEKADEMWGESPWGLWYRADLDNDGIEELYNKRLFWPSNNNINTVRHLKIDFYKDSQAFDLPPNIWSGNKIPQFLWVEKFNGKNIVCILSEKGIAGADIINERNEFIVECFYIHQEEYQTAVRLDFSPNYIIITEIYTQDCNADFTDYVS